MKQLKETSSVGSGERSKSRSWLQHSWSQLAAESIKLNVVGTAQAQMDAKTGVRASLAAKAARCEGHEESWDSNKSLHMWPKIPNEWLLSSQLKQRQLRLLEKK